MELKRKAILLIPDESIILYISGVKLQQCRFSLDIRKYFFTIRTVGPWNKLHREMVEIPSFLFFKKSLDKHWQGMI